jgi:hypothetical protein
MSMENHGGMISTGENPDSSTIALVNPTSIHLVPNHEEFGERHY